MPQATVAEPYPARFNQIAVEEREADGAMVLRERSRSRGCGGAWRSSASTIPIRSSWPLYTAALHAKHRGLLRRTHGHRHHRQTAQWRSSRSRRVSRMRQFQLLVLGPG